MKTIEFTAPDGQVYEADVPNDATAEQVANEWRKQQISERKKEPWYEDLAEGVALSGMETYYGIKDLATDLEPEEQARLEEWRQDAGQSGWGTAGQVVGEIGQIALPGGAFTKALRAGSKLAKVPAASRSAKAFTRALGDVGAATGLAAAQAPDVGETRGERAAAEAKAALTGEALGFGLSKAVRGIKKTPAAERMLKEGVRLTPGQSSSGAFIPGVEAIGEVTPFVAHGVKRARQTAVDDVSQKALEKAAAPGKVVTKSGTEGVAQLKKGFKEAYEEAWSGADSLSNSAKVAVIDRLDTAQRRLTKRQRNTMKAFLEDFKELTRDVTPQKMKNLDNDLRKRIDTASKKDYDFRELLTGLRDDIRKGLSNDVAEKLSAVDSKYGNFLVVRRAAKTAMEDLGVAKPRGLVSAVKAIGKDRAGEGTAPLQQYAVDAAQTAGRDIGGAPLEWFRRVAGITPTPFPMQAAGRTVLGQTGPQRLATSVADAIPEYLKRPGIAGAAYFNQPDEENY